MALEVGKAYLQIIPSLKGMESTITAELGGEAEKAGKKAGSLFGNSMSVSIGNLVSKAVSSVASGAASLVSDSISAGSDFDSAMSQVAATMGKTVAEIDDLRTFAQDMGRTTAFSATQAAEALNYMALAGYDTETSMGMLPNVLNLAAAGSMDLAKASDMITDAATAMGMKLEDGSVDIERVTLLTDEMAKAASTGNTSVEQLGEAFLVVGGLAQELNGGVVTLADGTQVAADGVQELEIALTGMANAGIKGSEAGTHMRNMLLKLASPSKEGAYALDTLGVSVFDVEGNMRSLKDIFSDMKNAMDGELRPSFESFYQSIASMTDAERLKQFKKSPEDFERLGISVVDAEGKLRSLEDVMAEVDSISENGGISQEFKIGLISDMFNTRDIASAEALLEAVEQDWDGIGEAVLAAKGSASAMADTQLENLAGDVVKFKGAFEGAQIVLSDALTPALRRFTQFGTESLTLLTDAYKEGGIEKVMETLGTQLTKGIEMVIGMIPGVISGGGKLVISIIQGLSTMLPELVAGLLQGVKTILLMLTEGNGLTMILDSLVNLVTGVVNEVSNFLVNDGETVLRAVMEVITTIILKIPEILPLLIETAVTLIDAVIKVLLDYLPEFFEASTDMTLALIDGLTEALPKIGASAGKIIGIIMSVIIEHLPEILITAIRLDIEFAHGMIKAIPKILEAVRDLIFEVVYGFQTFIEETNWAELGLNIVTGIKDGILGAAGDLLDTLTGVADSAIGGLKNFLGIASPSKLMRDEIGKFIPEGMVIGIEDEEDSVANAMNLLGTGSLRAVDASFAQSGSSLGAAAYAGASSGPVQLVAPIYIGDRLLDTVVTEATNRYNFRTGGR